MTDLLHEGFQIFGFRKLFYDFRKRIPILKNFFQTDGVLCLIVLFLLRFAGNDAFRTVTELFAKVCIPLIVIVSGNGGKRFFAIGRARKELFVCANGRQRSDRALNTVEIRRCSPFKRTHIHDMRNIMLHTGRGTGDLGIIHGNTRDHERFHDGKNRLFITVHSRLCVTNALRERILHDIRNGLAIEITDEYMCDLPFNNAHVFR